MTIRSYTVLTQNGDREEQMKCRLKEKRYV